MDLHTAELCIESVKSNGPLLVDVPESILNGPRGSEICLAAVMNNPFVVRAVPESILDGPMGVEICLAAVSVNGWAVSDVPESLLNGPRGYEIYLRAVTTTGYALFCLPYSRRDEVISRAAVASDPWALQHVPNEFKTLEMCVQAFTANPSDDVLYYIPEIYHCKLKKPPPLNPTISPLPEGLDISEMDDPIGLEPLSEMSNEMEDNNKVIYGFFEHAPGKYIPAGTLELFNSLISNKMFRCTKTSLFVAQLSRVEPLHKFIWCHI